jgi:HNH endonuclease.
MHMKYDIDLIKKLSDGKRSSHEIAEIVGCSAKYVQAQFVRYNLPRLRQGAFCGKQNHQYKSGRNIDRDGYVLISAPYDHPYARYRKGHVKGRILEHRFVMEKKIGRYLKPSEVVDHIDGNKLNNHPDNLRLFSSNGLHLKKTLKNQKPQWSYAGLKKMNSNNHQRKVLPKVDIYNQRKKSGDVRKQEILRAHEQLDKDSPFLLGTHKYLKPK